MRTCGHDFEIPIELRGEDVYDMFYIFDNEEEAIEYVTNEYNIDKKLFLSELHEEDSMRNEFGKDNYLRSAYVSNCIYLKELMSGEYILWEVY